MWDKLIQLPICLNIVWRKWICSSAGYQRQLINIWVPISFKRTPHNSQYFKCWMTAFIYSYWVVCYEHLTPSLPHFLSTMLLHDDEGSLQKSFDKQIYRVWLNITFHVMPKWFEIPIFLGISYTLLAWFNTLHIQCVIMRYNGINNTLSWLTLALCCNTSVQFDIFIQHTWLAWMMT